MGLEQILVVLAGALAGGLVSGLTGFGTGITAIGLWLHVLTPPVAASLVIACSVAAQIQNLPLIWRVLSWRRVLPFILPGLVGVPLGTWLLPLIEPRAFKIGVGVFLVGYAGYGLLRRASSAAVRGNVAVDGVLGLLGGVLGGMIGFSGVLLTIWTDLRGWTKELRRSVLQAFNLSVLSFALASHAASGLLGRDVALAFAAALPGTVAGAWTGARLYRRLGDRGYQRAVMALLLASGVVLIATS